MNVNVVDTIFYFTQNIGSSEDVTTGALATAFYYCPEFMQKFFSSLNKTKIPWIKKGNNTKYFIETGYNIKCSDYSWLSGNFTLKPDILISNADEKWDGDKLLKKQKLVLIESKLWASFGSKQLDNYREFKNYYSMNGSHNLKMIMISIEDYKEKADGIFDEFLNWNQIIEKSEKIFREMEEQNSEKIILQDIIEFLKLQLIPNIESFYNDNKKLCPKEILTRIKYRNLSHLSPKIKETNFNRKVIACQPCKISDTLEGYDAHQIYNELKRWGINKQDQASYFDINIDKIRVHVNCAINGNGDRAILWIEESSDKDIKLRKIIGNIDYSSNWHDNWLTLNNKICRELEMIANN